MRENQIKQLDEKTINLIAAGEVVESPVSIVKELIENAIDALATNIVLEIRDGGKTYIRITDDGMGIDESQVELAFQRHTTSKINSFIDFCNLSTNGFRGEALASIVAVSRTSIITKPKKSFLGTSLEILGGKVIKKENVGTKDGTTVIVEDLLYNTPARRNFLKSNQAETMKINDIIEKLALVNKDIKFKYINNNKVMLTTSGNDSFSGTMNKIYKNAFENSIKEINLEYVDDYGIEGFLGDNSVMSQSRKNQYIYVNKRVIKSKLITSVVEKAYNEFITVNRFPVFLINITIDPALIDVNIHPSKLEVKFTDENKIIEIIFNHIKTKLSESIMIPKSNISNKTNLNKNDEYTKISFEDYYKTKPQANYSKEFTVNNIEKKDVYVNDIVMIKTHMVNDVDSNTEYAYKKESINKSDNQNLYTNIYSFHYKDLKILGVFIKSYIITEYNETIYLIDQHAAHERILYEKYMKSYNNNLSTQDLIIPIPITLSFDISVYNIDLINLLNNYGFISELLSEESLVIRSIPNIFTQREALNLANELINSFLHEDVLTDELKDKIATKACKSAVKANDDLYDIEIIKLLSDLDNCKNKYACPHRRPITIQITKYELEKMFKRIV